MKKSIVASAILLLISSGCTQSGSENQSSSGKTKLAFAFPKADRSKVQGKASLFDYNNGCYAVSITGPGIGDDPATEGTAAERLCDQPYGVFAGTVAPTANPETDEKNQLKDLEIPFGENRVVTVYAYNKLTAGPCPTLTGDSFGDLPRDHIYVVGQSQPFTNDIDEMSVPVDIQMPSTNQNVFNQWALDKTCPHSPKPRPIAGVGGRTITQSGSKFVVHAKMGAVAQPTEMSGTRFKVRIKGR